MKDGLQIEFATRSYTVVIGDDYFFVSAKDPQEAKFLAARKFMVDHKLVCTQSKVVYYATASVEPEPVWTTDQILDILKEEAESVHHKTHLSLQPMGKVCPLCGNPTPRLDYHHWTEKGIVRQCRICTLCNNRLGVIFKGNYPTWGEQVKRMKVFFAEYNQDEVKAGCCYFYTNIPETVPVTSPRFTYSKRTRIYSVAIESRDYVVKSYNNRAAKREAIKLYKKDIGLTGPVSKYIALCKTRIVAQ
jgi:hypothetical protein